MKLTKNQLFTIVSTICSNEQKRLQEQIDKARKSKPVQDLVKQAKKELSTISNNTFRIMAGWSCSGYKMPSDETLENGAMYQLGIDMQSRLPNGFREQIELKVQMCFIDSKDLNDLEKKVGYKFVII